MKKKGESRSLSFIRFMGTTGASRLGIYPPHTQRIWVEVSRHKKNGLTKQRRTEELIVALLKEVDGR